MNEELEKTREKRKWKPRRMLSIVLGKVIARKMLQLPRYINWGPLKARADKN